MDEAKDTQTDDTTMAPPPEVAEPTAGLPPEPATPDLDGTVDAPSAAAASSEPGAAPEVPPPDEAAEEPAPPPEAEATVEPPPEKPAPPARMTMADLLDSEDSMMPGALERGSLVDGLVMRKDAGQLVLDIGAKQEGIVPGGDMARLPKDFVDSIQVGDTVSVVVVRTDGREGEVIVSLFQARSTEDWERAKEAMERGDVLELSVVGHNKGGLLVQYGNLQGFVPLSHMAAGGRTGAAPEQLAAMTGQVLAVKVIEVSRRRRRLIMSERQAMREWRAERKKNLIEELREGEVRPGVVSSVADFGAFVDLGGADGLVHVSEITHERGKHPRDVVHVGQEVQVYVLSVDRERKRIGLSLKRLQQDPWLSVEDDHYVGELVEGVISNLAKFGAFVRLDDGLEGLVHISELADQRVEHPKDVVRPGQRVTAEVISIDPIRRRLGLSLRRVPDHLRLLDSGPPVESTDEALPDPAALATDSATASDSDTDADPDMATDSATDADSAVLPEPEPLPDEGASADEL